MNSNPSKILVVLSAGLGDFLIAVPALKALRRRYPAARITLAVSSKTLSYAQRCPDANRVVALDAFHLFSPAAAKQLRLICELRAERFDLALNLYEISTFAGMLKMRALFAAISPALCAGRDTDGRGSFYDIRSPDSPADGADHGEHYSRLVDLLGCQTRPQDKAALWINADARQAAEDFLSANQARPGEAFLGIHPGSARRSRHWLPGRFAQTADALSRSCGLRVVILGGAGEAGLAEEVASLMEHNPLLSAGKLSFESSLALIQRLRLLICTHSSLMHAANAFSVSFVALQGISDMRRDGPYQPAPGRYVVIHTKNLRTLESDEVIAAGLELLKNG